jgi:hypothetical protein
MVKLIPGYKISILLAIAVSLSLGKWSTLYPGTRIVEEVSAAL